MRIGALALGIAGGGIGLLFSVSSLTDELAEATTPAAALISLLALVAYLVGLVAGVQTFRGSSRSGLVMILAGVVSSIFMLTPAPPLPPLPLVLSSLLVVGGLLGWRFAAPV